MRVRAETRMYCQERLPWAFVVGTCVWRERKALAESEWVLVKGQHRRPHDARVIGLWESYRPCWVSRLGLRPGDRKHVS